MARGRAAEAQKHQLEEPAAKAREYVERDIPPELYDEKIPGFEEDVTKTVTFGHVRQIGQKLLTPTEEALGVGRARGDGVRLAFELAQLSLAFVIDANGEEHRVLTHDGSQTQLWGELHPKIRALIMQAYGDDSTPTPKASAVFLASRRTRF